MASTAAFIIGYWADIWGAAELSILRQGLLSLASAGLIWHVAFPDRAAPIRRSLRVGSVIVVLSTWAMFTIMGLSLDATYLATGGLPAAVAKALLVALIFTVFGIIAVGWLLIPFAMAAAYVIQSRQNRE